MTHFLLIHGGAHGAWCWDRLAPFLRMSSDIDQVVAVDLTGHGARRDVKPLDEITLTDYVDDIVREIERRDLRNVMLVGHSLAGISMPLVASRIPDRIRRLVYLATSNPPVGQSCSDLMKHPLSPVSRGIDARQMFCSDLDEETAAWLLGKLGPEPAGPMHEVATIAGPPAGIASTYILLEKDQALPPDFQREQARNANADEIVPFEAGHSAFASRPKDLAQLLIELARA